MTSTSLTRKILFSLLLTLTLAGYANSQPYWTENRPAAGGPHNIPTRLFPADIWWNQPISQAPVDTKSASFITELGGVYPAYVWSTIYGLPFHNADDFEVVRLGW